MFADLVSLKPAQTEKLSFYYCFLDLGRIERLFQIDLINPVYNYGKLSLHSVSESMTQVNLNDLFFCFPPIFLPRFSYLRNANVNWYKKLNVYQKFNT